MNHRVLCNYLMKSIIFRKYAIQTSSELCDLSNKIKNNNCTKTGKLACNSLHTPSGDDLFVSGQLNSYFKPGKSTFGSM